MYPLHDDLVTTSGLTEYFAACPRPNANCAVAEDCTVYQWNGVTHFGGAATWNMQAILYHQSGDIVYQIGASNDETGSGSTTGIQNEAADDGLTYACDTAGSVLDDSGVCFFNPNPARCLRRHRDGCYPDGQQLRPSGSAHRPRGCRLLHAAPPLRLRLRS